MNPPDDRVSAYLDGVLSAADADAVAALAASDPKWAAAIDDERAVRSALRSLPAAAPPPGFWTDVMASVRADEDSVTSLESRRRARHTYRWVGAGVAASVLLFVGALAVPNERSVRPSVSHLAEAHSARAGAASDPVSPVAPVVVQAGLFK
ncbi:MAG: hypothetical protein ACOYNI_05615 [Acidimicrobiia bacterium]